ncbi:MAG: response regulator, partial [Holophaga sp.]|nr:response regulator [Holophaga sp.]
MSPKVLLVDDDPNILAAYTRTLRKRFQFDTAQGGDEALVCIRDSEPYGVILSDMRMPGMDGIQFLSRAKELSPDSVRIMLTGNADQNTAIEAVNQGNIFRFLTKPCDPDTLALSLEAGLKQYQLVTAERELVEGTLKGSLALLVDLLSIADPVAFARSQHLAPLAQKIAKAMDLESPWVV